MTRIAFPTDDLETISAHLGRARLYVVAEYDGDGDVRWEQRAKPMHGGSAHWGHQAPQSGVGEIKPTVGEQGIATGGAPSPDQHGPEAHRGPGGMLSPIADCDVLIAGGMGEPAYEGARQLGLTVILTGERRIEAALAAHQAGRLASDMRRVHSH